STLTSGRPGSSTQSIATRINSAPNATSATTFPALPGMSQSHAIAAMASASRRCGMVRTSGRRAAIACLVESQRFVTVCHPERSEDLLESERVPRPLRELGMTTVWRVASLGVTTKSLRNRYARHDHAQHVIHGPSFDLELRRENHAMAKRRRGTRFH